MSEWTAWHEGYTPGSPLARRLAVVQRFILEALDTAPPGPIQLISICAGDGRDIFGVLPGHPRRADVRARLVELDPDLAQRARDRAAEISPTHRGRHRRRIEHEQLHGCRPGTDRAGVWHLRQHLRRRRPQYGCSPGVALRTAREGDLDARDVRARFDTNHSGVVHGSRLYRGRLHGDPGDDRRGRREPADLAAAAVRPRPSTVHVPPARGTSVAAQRSDRLIGLITAGALPSRLSSSDARTGAAEHASRSRGNPSPPPPDRRPRAGATSSPRDTRPDAAPPARISTTCVIPAASSSTAGSRSQRSAGAAASTTSSAERRPTGSSPVPRG